MSDVTIPGGRIRSFVERIENIDTELQELNEQKKEVFSEAKGEGFDVKILKEIIKLRKQDQDIRATCLVEETAPCRRSIGREPPHQIPLNSRALRRCTHRRWPGRRALPRRR